MLHHFEQHAAFEFVPFKLHFEDEYIINFGGVPERLFMYSLAVMIQAKTLVEIGVAFGDGLYWLCKAAEATGGHVHGFDCWGRHGRKRQFGQFSSKEQVSDRMHKAGLSAFTLRQVDTGNKGFRLSKYIESLDFASIDGDHSYDGVKRDFENCMEVLSDQGIIILHDCMIIDGVRQLILELEQSRKYFMLTLPYGADSRKSGMTIVRKRISSGVNMDELCGAPMSQQEIYEAEMRYFGFRR